MLKLNELSIRQSAIFNVLEDGDWHTTTYIIAELLQTASTASIKRDLKILFDAGLIEQFGKARATKYRRSQAALFLNPIDLDKYFSRPQEERGKNIRFNLNIFSELESVQILNPSEKKKLTQLLNEYRKNIKSMSPALLKREFERVTIDLSWKSSSIEGNTYTLLETETLLKDGIPASGKTSAETAMLLNHKSALEYIQKYASDYKEITISKIENIHAILIDNLSISKNIRKRIVGITGTNYKPLDNEFQIREAVEMTCQKINEAADIFTKALLAILLISYIQPFEDGNKRTARLMGNAILLSNDAFPLSFRSVDVTQYKKAILLFYELNNLSEFKTLFLEQAHFAVKEYFR